MSYEMQIEMETKLSKYEIMRVLFPTIIKYQENSEYNYIRFKVDRMTIIIGNTEDDYFSGSLGILPDIYITFILIGDHNSESQVLEIAIQWLQKEVGDMALFGGDYVMLMRKDGKLTRNSFEDIWTSEMLDLITLSHEVKHLPPL